MAWTRVETPNATYVVSLHLPYKQARLPVKGIDTVVLEGIPEETTMLSPDFRNLIDAMLKGRKPIFGGDISPYLKKLSPENVIRMLTVSFVSRLTRARGVPPALPYVFGIGNELKLRKPLMTPVFWFHDHVMADPVTGRLRNALIAQKCEQFIAPEMQKRLGRKPVIGIAYIATQGGIIRMLQSPRSRDRTISHFRKKFRDKTKFIYDVVESAPMISPKGKFYWKDVLHKEAIRETPYRTVTKRMMARARLARMKLKRAFRRKPH